MKFKFNLESVLKHRKMTEDFAQKAYIEAKERLDLVLADINSMYASIDNARVQMSRVHLKGGVCKNELVDIEAFIKGQKVKIEREKIKVRELMIVQEEKYEELLQASMEYKAIEKLKERREHEHKLRVKKREAKENDEIATMRFKWGEAK